MTVLQRVWLVRGLRGFGDGCISLVLPFYLTALGLSPWQVGTIAAATMLGSGVMSLGVAFSEQRHGTRGLLLFAALLMAGTGAGFYAFADFWPLFIIAFVGTINPSNGDVSLFLPLEHTTIAGATRPRERTRAFARYSLIAALCTAVGSLSAGAPQWLAEHGSIGMPEALKLVFLVYGALGVATFFIYRGLPVARTAMAPEHRGGPPLKESRGVVLRLTALFSLDSFSSGFTVQSLMVLWLNQRFDLPLATAGTVFFCTSLISALSYPAAAALAHRIGAIRTMVYTHVPGILIMALIPFMPSLSMALGMLMLRSIFVSMDVPARSAFVMNAVSEHERAAAASFTTVPKSLAGGLSPSIAGWMLSLSGFGWNLVVSAVIKTLYICLLYRMFRDVEAEQARRSETQAGEQATVQAQRGTAQQT